MGLSKKVRKAVIYEDHTASVKTWERMGSPSYPNLEQLSQVHAASELVFEDLGAVSEIRFTAQPESVTILNVS